MPKPICVKCGLFFRPKKNGVSWIEGKPIDNQNKPGKDNDHLWSDYKLWLSDLWECCGCGTEIIVGHAQKPMKEYWQPDWSETKLHYRPIIRINDC